MVACINAAATGAGRHIGAGACAGKKGKLQTSSSSSSARKRNNNARRTTQTGELSVRKERHIHIHRERGRESARKGMCA